MSDVQTQHGTARNERVVITDAERKILDAAATGDAKGRAGRLAALRDDPASALAREASEEARKALSGLIPDFEARASGYARRFAPRFADLKGVVASSPETVVLTSTLHHSPFDTMKVGDTLDLDAALHPHPHPPVQPAHAREFWWAETNCYLTCPPNTLFWDIDHDPYRLWGHIGYGGDRLMGGTAGMTMTFILGADRLPITSRRDFLIRPDLHTMGWVSGWTGHYHPIWHADDKWSKCWFNRRLRLTLSTGEVLDDQSFNGNLFFLEDVNPVGQANLNETMGWTPILRAGVDIADLRRRGVSMIVTADLRYDFQLEGESDIWFRNRPGSQQQSPPGFDNALGVRVNPGILENA
ncbi:MAG: hypothetical protein U1E62_14105 [Alsobacter sp.]